MRPYPLLSAFLGCIFCIFTVGIPVVLASCPMMQSPGQEGSCCPESTRQSEPVIGMYKNTSCCTTTLVATRSTQEYLQSASGIATDTGFRFVATAADVAAVSPDAAASASVLSASPPPPLHRPLLPVLHSALLI